MKKYLSGFIALSLTMVIAKAQVSQGGLPPSFNYPQLKTTVKINKHSTPKLNIEQHLKEDEKDELRLRYSKYHDVNINIKERGTKTKLDNGVIWQYRVVSKNAYSLGLQFSEYKLPEGAKLFIYSPDNKRIAGAFTSFNNKENGKLSLAEFSGNELIIEYFEPFDAEFAGSLVLGKVGQAYRKIFGAQNSPPSEGFIDINCREGDQLQLEKHSVAKMSFEEQGSGYICTGNLINTTKNDGTPYFLTANHCISKDLPAQTLITYFNFERDDCEGKIDAGQTISGSSLISTYRPTDFTLLLLSENIPRSYQPYYAGWNAESDSAVASGGGIHHPSGDEKKVSVEYQQIVNDPEEIYWDDGTTSPPNTHWLVGFDKGRAVGGSSGSALFDENKRIIGQLHGGIELEKNYGKLSVSWSPTVLDIRNLKDWLDPDNEGILVHDGYSPSNLKPEAHFYSDFKAVCPGEPIQLYDGSLFGVNAWSWSFTPSTVTYHEGTDQNSQNPVVSFNEANDYTIELTVTRSSSTDTRTRIGYITAGSNLAVEMIPSFEEIICHENFTGDFYALAHGASAYHWKVTQGSEFITIDESTLDKDKLLFSRNDVPITKNEDIIFKLIGSHGSCTDSSFSTIKVLNHPNDNVADAIELSKGMNGPFYNHCATKEEFEDSPLPGECNNQSEWCICGDKRNLIENSVWFTFTGPESGLVTLDAPGFDNQLAVYDANNAADLVGGDSTKYTIVAANDDYFGENKNYSALIENLSVTPGKKYWVQVDGSACGEIGEFYINMTDTEYTKPEGIFDYQLDEEIFNIFPNPATSYINMVATEDIETAEFKLLSVEGKVLFSKQLAYIQANEDIQISIPYGLSNGLYLVHITSKEYNYIQMLILSK